VTENAVAARAKTGTVARMKRSLPSVFAFTLSAVLFCAPLARAAENMMNAAAVALGGHFVKPSAFDVAKVLPPPPEAGSLAAKADLDVVLHAQAWRTPEEAEWARLVDKDNAFSYSSVLGAWFTNEKLPVTAKFLSDVTEDANAVGALTKALYARQRPSQIDPRVQPLLPLPTSASYPSGHVTRAYTWALTLAEIFPEQRAALLERAHRAAWGRVLAGVHFPSDLIGGQLMAEAIVAELKKSEAFRAGVEQCRAEAAGAKLKKAS
jgi:acid phosphatase (class A)